MNVEHAGRRSSKLTGRTNDTSGVFPVTSSILACEALSQAVEEHYPLCAGVTCELLKVGTNDTYLVTSGDRRAVLKAYTHGVRSYDEIVGEVELVRLLHDHHAPVARPFRREDGTMVLTVNAPEGPRRLALFAYADGEIGDFGPEHLALLGRSLAEIHACADRFDETPFRRHLDVQHTVREPIKLIRPVLTDDKDVSLLSTMAAAIECAVEPLSLKPPLYGLCHGDVGGYNSHVDDQGIMTHFDFDFCGYGWRAYDLAVFLWSRNMICDARTANRHWRWFVDGYESVRQLTPQEHSAIPYFVLCRSLWLAGFGKRTHASSTDKHIHNSVRFMREWFASRCTEKDLSRKGGQQTLMEPTGKMHSCLIPHHGKPLLLLLRAADNTWSLPRARLSGPGLRNPTPKLRGVLEMCGIGDLNVSILRFARISPDLTAWECQNDDRKWQPPSHARWVGRGELENLELTDAVTRQILDTWFQDSENPPVDRVAWERPGWWSEPFKWIQDRFSVDAQLGVDREERGKVGSPWNYVTRIASSSGGFFFKAIREWDWYEPRLTATLAELFPSHIPPVVAIDIDRRWLLTRDCGRHLEPKGEHPSRIERALAQFAQVQIDSIPHLDAIAKTGCPDLRRDEAQELERVFEAAGRTLANANPRAAEQAGNIPVALSTARDLLLRMQAFAIPHTLVHGDFTWINIIANRPNDLCVFIDWGGASINHPFLSMVEFIRHGGSYAASLPSYLEPWLAYEPMDRLLQALATCKQLGLICQIRDHVRMHPHADLRLTDKLSGWIGDTVVKLSQSGQASTI